MRGVHADQQALSVRIRRVRLVEALFPLSPAAASYTEAYGALEEVPTFHLYTLRSKLRREAQYLGLTKRHSVEEIVRGIDAELERRRRLSQM